MSTVTWILSIVPPLRLLVATVLFAASTVSAVNAQELLILTGSDPSYLPVTIAVEKGFLQKQGINASQRIFPSGADAMLAFKTIGAPFIASASLPSIILWNEGSAVGIARLFAAPDYQGAVVSPNIKVAGDLVGKTIATKMGSSAEYFLYSYLKRNHIDTAKVKVLDLGPSEMVAALGAGQIDGFFLWVPFPALAQKMLGDKAKILATSKGYFTETIYLTVDRRFAQQNPETVVKVLRALREATDYIQSHPDEAANIGAQKFHTQAATVAETIALKPFTISQDQESADLISDVSQFLYERGRLKMPPRAESDVFDRTFLRSIDPKLAAVANGR